MNTRIKTNVRNIVPRPKNGQTLDVQSVDRLITGPCSARIHRWSGFAIRGNRLFVFLLLFAQSIGSHFVTAHATEPAGHTFFYVSPGGDDEWSGRLPSINQQQNDGPFATLERARDAIRQLKANGPLTGPVTVMLLSGTYRLSEPFVLTGEDSGTPQAPITYTAYPGQQPVLSGGQPISGWTPYRGQVLQCSVPEARKGKWKFRQLFFNGQRYLRARWPNNDQQDPLYTGWTYIDQPIKNGGTLLSKFSYDPVGESNEAGPETWTKVEQAEINIFPWYCWVNDIVPVKQIDAADHTIELARDIHFSFMSLMAGNRFYVENVLEALDRPGEWFLDSDSGTVYFWPPDETIQIIHFSDVIAPVLDSLIELRGTLDQPIRNITIAKLTLAHTRSPFPDRQHDSHHSPMMHGAAVTLAHCRDCRVSDNRCHLLGGNGIRLQGANRENRVERNEVAHTGGAGVSLASDQPWNTNEWDNQELLEQQSGRYPKLVRNVITNNHIHHCGVFKKNCGGVHLFAINSVDNVISHNLIHDMSDKGMTMQDGYGRFIVEYNDMHHLGLEIADTGGVMVNRWYPLSSDPELAHGNIVRFNLIRDVIGCGAYSEERHPKGEGDGTRDGGKLSVPYYTWGIYFDNSGVDNLIFGNIVDSAVLGGVAVPVGSPQNNHIENNIFIGSSAYQMDLQIGSASRGNRFVRNILTYTNPGAALLCARNSISQSMAECDYNVLWAGGAAPRIHGNGDGSLSEWRKRGFDRNSLVADPLLIDAENGDYRLHPDSPAFTLGFQPIDVEQIGLQNGNAD